MKRLILIGSLLMLTSCARVNQLQFTDNGVKTTTRGEVSIEYEQLPDGTRKANFLLKKECQCGKKSQGIYALIN